MISKTEVHTTTWDYRREGPELAVTKRNGEKFPYTIHADEPLNLNDLRNLKELIDTVIINDEETLI